MVYTAPFAIKQEKFTEAAYEFEWNDTPLI